MPNPWARLGPLAVNDGEDFIFTFVQDPNGVSQLAPNSFTRSYAANYVQVPVAQADHLPEEWKSNNPGELALDCEIVGGKQLDIARSLRRLRKYMRKDRRTGEPPYLVLVVGQRQWTCRLVRLTEHPVLWNADTAEIRAKISMTLHTTKWED